MALFLAQQSSLETGNIYFLLSTLLVPKSSAPSKRKLGIKSLDKHEFYLKQNRNASDKIKAKSCYGIILEEYVYLVVVLN